MKRLGAGLAVLLLCACAGSPVTPGAVSGMSVRFAPAGQVVGDVTQLGPAVSRDLYGSSVATWSDLTHSGVASNYKAMGLHMVRFPGGSESDIYHWANGGSLCPGQGGYIYPPSTFDNLIADIAAPANLDVAVTLNYGSNPACNAGGDPSEAAAWVAYSKSKGYPVRWWTVGNEVYGSWEFDLHSPPHDAATYANAVSTGYYPDIKAQDPNAQVGVVVAGSYEPSWDSIVLKNAKFDFVEYHIYPEAPGSESDSRLLTGGVSAVASGVSYVRSEMNTAGVPASVPIYLGEFNSVYSTPGKQSVSIVNGLFTALSLGELMKQGLTMATWWLSYGGCDTNGNNSSTLYGWQNYGTYTLFSDQSCSAEPAYGTPFPSARAYQVFSQFAPPGSQPAATSVSSGLSNIRAYTVKTSSGYAFLLVNIEPSKTTSVSVNLKGATKSSFTASRIRYGKTQYDASKNNVWTAPASKALGTVSLPYTLSLPPYSMTALILQ